MNKKKNRLSLILVLLLVNIFILSCTNKVEVDGKPPVINITNPTDGSTIFEPINITVEANDNEEIARVEFYVDSLQIKIDEEPSYDAYFNPYYYSNGENHSIMVKAIDVNGNISLPAEVQIIIPSGIENFPNLILPEDKTFIKKGDEVNFVWNSLIDANRYEILIASDHEFNKIIHEASINDTIYSTVINETEQLFWKIRAFDFEDKPSNWSIIRTFYYDEIISFSKNYKLGENSAIKNVLQLNDGGYVFVGYKHYTPSLISTVFMKIDKYGNMIYMKEFDDLSWRVYENMIEADDGNFILAGYIVNDNSRSIRNMMLVKVDEFGEIIWGKEFYTESNDRIDSIIKSNDGGYLILGTQGLYNGFERLRIIKIDENGNQSWEHLSSGGTLNGFDIIQSDSGEILITFNFASTPDTSFDNNLRVKKLNQEGEQIWHHSFFDISSSNVYSGFIQKSTNGYIIAGKNNSDIYVLEIDNDGELLLENTFSFDIHNLVSSFEQTSDGNYILTGSTYYSNWSKLKLLHMKLNSNGNSLWHNSYQIDDNKSFGTSSVECYDKGFIIGGCLFNQNEQNMWLLKTDEMGQLVN